MSTLKDYRLELTDYEQVALEKREQRLKIEIAINMLKNNEPIEKVSSYTGLKIFDVEELKKSLE